MIQLKHRTNQKGQAIVEYMLVLVLILGVWVSLDSVVRLSIKSSWRSMARMIASGCPECAPPPELGP